MSLPCRFTWTTGMILAGVIGLPWPSRLRGRTFYARNLRRSSVYTPQLVVDGRDDYVGSDGRAVATALSENRDGVPVGVSVRDAEVLVEIGAQPGVLPNDVTLVSYLR